MAIAEMVGIPSAEWERFKHWSDGILKLSYSRSGGEETKQARIHFNEDGFHKVGSSSREDDSTVLSELVPILACRNSSNAGLSGA